MSSLKRLIDSGWAVRVGRNEHGSYVADGVPMDEDNQEIWERYCFASDTESPENALKVLEAKCFGLVIDYPNETGDQQT